MTETIRRQFVDIVADAGITYRQADHWIRRGYVHVQGGEGSGNPRHIDDAEVTVMRTMAHLVHGGIEVATAARIAREWVADGRNEHPLATGVYLTLTGEGESA